MLPQVLGENFSLNILTLFWVVFLRYVYNRFLEEKEKNTPFVKELLETRLIEDILREGLWYKKAPSFIQRPLGFRMHPADIRREGGKLVMVFLKALLDTPFVCGREEDMRKFKRYIEGWLKLAGVDRSRYERIENFFRNLLNGDFKKWFEENFDVELIEDNCLWNVNRQRTLIGAASHKSMWITKEIAEELGLEMSDDELFPLIKEKEEKRIEKWISDYKKKKS